MEGFKKGRGAQRILKCASHKIETRVKKRKQGNVAVCVHCANEEKPVFLGITGFLDQ